MSITAGPSIPLRGGPDDDGDDDEADFTGLWDPSPLLEPDQGPRGHDSHPDGMFSDRF